MIRYDDECAWASSWESEGDGVKMLTFCHKHPEFRWYSDAWPTQTEELEKMQEHQAALKPAE